jgi:tRNA-splicing ligase RtcB (3'-phosphate/5'-hydroxy nucleic acid ligase)
MSRNQAKKIINISEHKAATKHVECRKDKKILDESPAAYKKIEDVMRPQNDLIEIIFTLRQILCVKG